MAGNSNHSRDLSARLAGMDRQEANPSNTKESLIDDVRRGEIIWVLRQDYPHLVTFRHLQLALRDRNIPLSQNNLEEYLSYLEESRYIRCEHHFDERDSQDRIVAAALTAHGILLFDKKITDPGVRF